MQIQFSISMLWYQIRRIRSQGEGITVDTTATTFLGGKKAEDGNGGNVLSMV